MPPHQVNVDLDEYVCKAAREAARTVIAEHTQNCIVGKLEERVHNVEIGYARLIGFMAGSGLLGGAVGSLLSTAL